MQKDVIYIDVDDDITAIIGKIKDSKEKIVAIVPPKRVGVLQSAVNLRLLDRMAKSGHKKLVIITNNQALISLAAAAKIPTAKNLQSKPEIAEIPALKVDDDDDIIDGGELPVGDHAHLAGPQKTPVSRDDVIEELEDSEAVASAAVVKKVSTKPSAKSPSKKSKSSVKIPNFDIFRKKLVLVILGIVVVTSGLIWMFLIAPAATIVITASGAPAPLSTTVKLVGADKTTSPGEGIISAERKEIKKDATTEITPTGKKEVGTKATGTVILRNCAPSSVTISAGTTLTQSGNQYTTDESITIAAGSCAFFGGPAESDPVGVTAAGVGSAYNTSSGTMSVSGSSSVQAVVETAISGGESHEVTVVSDDDIERAIGQIVGQSNDTVKAQLKRQFTGDDIVVIDSSFLADRGDVKSSPAKGEEVAEGKKATLTIPMTYSIYGITKANLKTYLDAKLSEQVKNKDTQQVLDNGVDEVSLGNFQKAEDGTLSVSLVATGKIGPKLDEVKIKEQIKGKITGDVQRIIESIDGVRSVEVNYSFFWVRTVPGDTNKIKIEFEVADA